MWYNTTPDLTDNELRDLVGWFMFRMDQDTRGDLMAERPVQYAKLCPEVAPERIAELVTRGVNRIRSSQASDHAIKAGDRVACIDTSRP